MFDVLLCGVYLKKGAQGCSVTLDDSGSRAVAARSGKRGTDGDDGFITIIRIALPGFTGVAG